MKNSNELDIKVKEAHDKGYQEGVDYADAIEKHWRGKMIEILESMPRWEESFLDRRPLAEILVLVERLERWQATEIAKLKD